MKLKFLQTKTKRFLLKSIFALSLLSIISAATFAQYSNGNLSTGATTNSGTAAPAGFTWSEVQLTNASAGLSASVQNGFSVADDFVVPVGQTWTLTKVTFYAYSTGYAGATSPFNDTRVRIFNTNPSVGAPVPVFGDLTTNRFSASTSAAMYRIFPTPANPSGTTRHIWKIEATVATVLTAGTYWIEWQHNPIVVASSNFSPAVTVVGTTTQAGNNALQHTIAGNTWAAILDGTPAGPQAMPFDITYTASGAPCTGTPAPGNTLSTITTGCLGVPFSLSLQNATTGIGVTYQWQSGTSLTGPWTNIGGATNNTYSSSVSTGGFYRCNVTCGANTGASNGVQVALTPASGCYCANTATDPADEDILNVTLGTLNNTSTCTSVGPGFGSVVKQYANYTSGTGAPAAPNVIQGAANPISVQVGTCNGNWGNMVAVWIDLNQDGTFQHPAERVFISPASVTGPNTQVGNVVIPATALLGTTRMRVQVREFGTAANMVPCGNFTWGEVEDYNVNIVPCIPVTITTAPANATAVCGGNASFSVVAAGSIPAYQWQSKSTVVGSLWTNIAGATSATLNLTGVTGALSGYQYRVLFSGACTSPNVTTAATLTVNPITAAVTPTSALLCQGGVQQLTITNIASPSPGSVTVNSATLNMNVPDDNPAGVNTTITIPALPAGATVIGASVKLNVASTWVGDLNVNLKAPNNQILNLSHNLSVTNGNASGGGSFVNTVIGSAFTTPLHTSSSPASTHTGNYKADAGTITVSGITPNVTGFVPSTASWNSLLTTPSGVWTLAMADIWGGGDITTFQNWSLTIDYLLGSPATGVYTGPTGTIYTDAAATVPYTGTAINTVYVKPTATGVNNYSVVVTDGPCPSNPLIIPVTMNAPAAGTLSVSNATLCAGLNNTFAITGLTGGTSLTYQWQVSTDAGATYSNIAGATSATLVQTGVTTAMSGNKYRVLVSSTGCTTTLTSSAGTLTVNPTPVVTISAAPITKLFPGLTSTLTAAVSPNAASTYQWYKNGVLVTGATLNKTVVDIDKLGTYTVRVSDVNGCVSNGVSTPASILITDSVTTNKLFIYPSPNSGQFQVRYYNAGNAPTYVNIFDEKGARVFTQIFGANTAYQSMNVDLSGFGRGIYRVDVLTANGNRINTGSVMVF